MLKYDLRTTEQTKPTARKYSMEILGDPEKYVPETRYTITIKGDSFRYRNPKFKQFIISLEPRNRLEDSENIIPQIGNFELGADGHSKFSDKCKDTVVEENTQPKHLITLTWKAPPPNSGCVSIRAVIIESHEKWFETDEFDYSGPLAKTLCEDFSENEDVKPEIEKVCCACNDAKYEVAFEGKWIRNMHPKGFPEDVWSTRFSYIIGYSHKLNHAFWEEDSKPSDGMKELAFNGSTKTLEKELFRNTENARTIFRTAGVAYPNITSASYTTIRVDNVNHLVTMAAKMIPSPDWIVGVSNMELCLPSCLWRESRSLNLYPWDVGIDDAFEYTSNEPSSNLHPVITKITSSNPKDERSPFYDPSGEPMKPIATVHFKLKKVSKECDPELTSYEPEKEENIDMEYQPISKHNCETIGWSQWSSCSAQCGRGHMTRNVIFRHNPEPNDCLDIKKDETMECTAPCQSGEERMSICNDHIWSSWTPCSASCGRGLKHRFRVPNENGHVDEINRLCPNKEEVECFESDC